jgi:Flp pilus assembly protein TadG
VEFAIVAPVLFLVLLGIVEFSRGFMVMHLLTDTAHQACRTAIVGGKSTAAIGAMVTTSLATKGISGHTTTVKVNGASSDASSAASGDEIEVTISVPASAVGWLPSQRFLQVNLTGHWGLRVE